MSVIVYTTPTCGFCHQVKTYLNQRRVPYIERDVSRDQQAAMEMIGLSGQQGVPVVLIDGQLVLGFNRPAIDQLLMQRANRPPKLGVSIADASRIAEKKGVQMPAGAYVGRVNPASPAALGGIQPGDVITQLDGRPVRSDQDVHQIVASARYDQDLNVQVWRKGQTRSTRVRL
jgi:glutaredoxin-like YruB-family protein